MMLGGLQAGSWQPWEPPSWFSWSLMRSTQQVGPSKKNEWCWGASKLAPGNLESLQAGSLGLWWGVPSKLGLLKKMNDVGGPPSWPLATLRASKLVLLVFDEEYHVWPSKTNLESIESLTYLEWKPKNGAEDKEYRPKLQRYLPLQSKDMVICWIMIYKLFSIQCRHIVCNVCYNTKSQNIYCLNI